MKKLDYTNQELMAICGARLLWEGAVVMACGGLSNAPCMLAQKLNIKKIKVIYDSGIIDTDSDGSIKSAVSVKDTRATLGEILQGGYVDIGLIEGSQIDKYGNINSTAIGNYKRPKMRLGGSGSVNDIASCAKNTFIITLHEKSRLHGADYVTAPGHLFGKNSREKSGLRGNGPKYIITDLCIFDFHEKSKKARILSLHPGVTKKEVLKNMSWRPIIPWKIPTTKPPAEIELKALRKKFDIKKSGIN
jgi:glutaconate CoA-transferase, subunit B